jgi:hypothetical protein
LARCGVDRWFVLGEGVLDLVLEGVLDLLKGVLGLGLEEVLDLVLEDRALDLVLEDRIHDHVLNGNHHDLALGGYLGARKGYFAAAEEEDGEHGNSHNPKDSLARQIFAGAFLAAGRPRRSCLFVWGWLSVMSVKLLSLVFSRCSSSGET